MRRRARGLTLIELMLASIILFMAAVTVAAVAAVCCHSESWAMQRTNLFLYTQEKVQEFLTTTSFQMPTVQIGSPLPAFSPSPMAAPWQAPYPHQDPPYSQDAQDLQAYTFSILTGTPRTSVTITGLRQDIPLYDVTTAQVGPQVWMSSGFDPVTYQKQIYLFIDTAVPPAPIIVSNGSGGAGGLSDALGIAVDPLLTTLFASGTTAGLPTLGYSSQLLGPGASGWQQFPAQITAFEDTYAPPGYSNAGWAGCQGIAVGPVVLGVRPVWMVDQANRCVLSWSPAGFIPAAPGRYGANPGGDPTPLIQPWQVAYDPSSGSLWITDLGNMCLRQYLTGGQRWGPVVRPPGRPISLHGVAVDPVSGTVYTADSNNLWVYQPGPMMWTSYPLPTTPPGPTGYLGLQDVANSMHYNSGTQALWISGDDLTLWKVSLPAGAHGTPDVHGAQIFPPVPLM